jgi:hypothetical protein
MGAAISGTKTDERTTFADVFWQGALKWNQGVHNTMIYATGNIQSGTYDPTRLANLGFGWVAVDGGDHLVSARQNRWGNREGKCLGGLEVHDHLKFCRQSADIRAIH